MAGRNKAIKTPYLPIEKFDPKQIQDRTTKEAELEKDSGFVDLNSLLAELPYNSSDNGRDVFSKEVATLLHGMGMEKYFDLFKTEDISLETFFQLSYNDLNQLGITNPVDQDKIIKNIKEIKNEDIEYIRQNKQYIVPPNSYEDFVIAKNILNQVILLQSYGSYTILQMKKNELYDYFVARDETAVGVLKFLAGQAIKQANRIDDFLYGGGLKGDNLITTAIEHNYKDLPASVQKRLLNDCPKKKTNKKKTLWFVIGLVGGLVGVSSVLILIGKQILQPQRLYFNF